MKCIDPQSVAQLPGRRLGENDRFFFRCHSRLACFNRCCRNLNLFIYPYDVIRLKRALGISSDQFIDQHVDIVLREGNYFPDVLLRMADTPQRTCPFLDDSGCSVYPHRPDTCRTFPVEQGALFGSQGKCVQMVRFFRPPDFCLGQHEACQWTVATWLDDQKAQRHNQMTLAWAELKRLFSENPWGSQGPDGPLAKMTFMATYNIDRFRDFVFNSTFLKRYKVKPALLSKLRASDRELLEFGFDWVRFFVWQMPAKRFKGR